MSRFRCREHFHLQDAGSGLAHQKQSERPPTPLVRRWREWGVSEQLIKRALEQRAYASQLRATEDYVHLEGFAYVMPRLPLVQKAAWGVAKSIDYEGTIYVKETYRTDRIDERYRYTYLRPRIVLETRTYEIVEEIATMMHVAVMILHVSDPRLARKVVSYRTTVSGARGVRVAYLTEPHLRHPEKKRRARQILETYRERPELTA